MPGNAACSGSESEAKVVLLSKMNLWEQVLARVETKVGRHSFYTWFKPTTFITENGNSVAVRVPNAHFKDWLTMSPVLQTPDFATWETLGKQTAAEYANQEWKRLLETYEDPGLDGAVDEELRGFMERRKSEPAEPDE